ncbi:ras-related and estrogen-regulated growth inhibitor-like protein [Trichonephila inaurata madagascariensis]|uniref:Ras-related and estrogen-regulated growth inhibitor-like protein n=1 Tax=Trichonephila inaurata madagascariensis TaxID=2747483 RepID=A0A8X7BP34_9ARAC|nr:ras-related and estrogen-regulated growth inhibitor-like protein [Trichonephila inaurata madagascariensis]
MWLMFAGPYKLYNRRENLTIVHKNPQWAPQLTTRETRGAKVTQEEGERVSKFYPNVEFKECSAAEGFHSVEVVFNDFLKTVAKSKDSKKHMTSNSLTVSKSPSPRRHSAGNSALSHWWRRPRSSSACEHNRQDRTYTM